MKLFDVIALSAAILTLGTSTVFSGDPGSTTITFGDVSRDIGNIGPIVESGYQYNAIGASWQLISSALGEFPGDGNALVTFWGIFPALGNTITFERLDHGQFLFQQLDLRGRLDNRRNDVVLVQGFLDGVQVASQILQSSNEVWRVELTNPSFANPIDTLRFEVVELNGSTLMFDNLVFAPVPEPTAGALLALGLAGAMWRSRRYRIQGKASPGQLKE